MSMELAKTQCYEFKCFEDNYSLTISTQGCPINTRKINTKKNNKLDLNLSKTKQPLPIITNSHLKFRYLTAPANLETQNLKIDLRHTWLNTALQLVGKNLVHQKNSLGTCIPFDIMF